MIITGLSGSGKTVVSRFLEDLGYYCMDNLPAKLILNFVDLWMRKEVEIERVALVVDMREREFITEFPKVWKQIRKKIPAKLIFLDASDETLVKRFSETRRPHPLARNKPVIEGVRLERERLAEIKKMADEVVDTTAKNIIELKEILLKRFAKNRRQEMQVVLISFGYKYGIPLDSDLVFDTRFLPNPFYLDRLREKTGKNLAVKEFVMGEKETKDFLERLFDFVNYMLPKFISEGKSYLTIAIGCTGGKHRSVVLAEELRKYLQKKKYAIKIYHRDIYK